MREQHLLRGSQPRIQYHHLNLCSLLSNCRSALPLAGYDHPQRNGQVLLPCLTAVRMLYLRLLLLHTTLTNSVLMLPHRCVTHSLICLASCVLPRSATEPLFLFSRMFTYRRGKRSKKARLWCHQPPVTSASCGYVAQPSMPIVVQSACASPQDFHGQKAPTLPHFPNWLGPDSVHLRECLTRTSHIIISVNSTTLLASSRTASRQRLSPTQDHLESILTLMMCMHACRPSIISCEVRQLCRIDNVYSTVFVR